MSQDDSANVPDEDTRTASYKGEVIAQAPTQSRLVNGIHAWFKTRERDTSSPIRVSNKYSRPIVVNI